MAVAVAIKSKTGPMLPFSTTISGAPHRWPRFRLLFGGARRNGSRMRKRFLWYPWSLDASLRLAVAKMMGFSAIHNLSIKGRPGISGPKVGWPPRIVRWNSTRPRNTAGACDSCDSPVRKPAWTVFLSHLFGVVSLSVGCANKRAKQ